MYRRGKAARQGSAVVGIRSEVLWGGRCSKGKRQARKVCRVAARCAARVVVPARSVKCQLRMQFVMLCVCGVVLRAVQHRITSRVEEIYDQALSQNRTRIR